MRPESFLGGRVNLYHGDCLGVLNSLEPNSIDSIVTDPPYGLGREPDALVMLRAWIEGDCYEVRSKSGFMGKEWDAFVPQPAVWKAAFRALKPGGYALSYFGTRTYDLGVLAMRIAGFEVRDLVAWLYGSGFPKSLDVSKAIDKAAGAEREVLRERYTVKRIKPGATVVAEGKWGKQEIPYTARDTAPATEAAVAWQGFGTALKPAIEPIVLARKPLIGTVAENVLKHGTGALNIDGCRVATDETAAVGSPSWGGPMKRLSGAPGQEGKLVPRAPPKNNGRWPANVVHDGSDEVLAAFPNAPGQQRYVGPEHGERPSRGIYGDFGARSENAPRGDSGSAARFFYCAKADSDDRLGSKHPTVKPLDLMQWLVRLVTPPGGLVLDPFAGTGTTGEAAFREGLRSILIEREAEYCEDIRRRMGHVTSGPDERKRVVAKEKAKGKSVDLGPLFA